MALLLLGLPASGRWAAAEVVERIEKPVAEAVAIRQQTQKVEEQWRDERQALIAELEALEQEQARLLEQKTFLTQTTSTTELRIAVKARELADIEQMASQIQPFLDDQVIRLAAIMDADPPFLTAERRQRAETLSALLGDPDVPPSEKLRKTMEALFVEGEYGDTIEVYQEMIAIEGQPVLVNIFRLGRLSLFYQTLDRKRCGFYDVAANRWQPLPSGYNRPIQAAVEIGSRRKPVELLSLPLGRLVVR